MKSLIKSSFKFTFFKLLSYGIIFLITIFIPIVLSETDYAEFGYLFSILSFINLFNFGIPTSMQIELSKSLDSVIFPIILSKFFFEYILYMSILFFFLLFSLVFYLDLNLYVSIIIIISSMSFLIGGLFQIYSRNINDMKFMLQMLFIQPLMAFLAIIFYYYFDFNFFILYSCGYFIFGLFYFIKYFSEIRFSHNFFLRFSSFKSNLNIFYFNMIFYGINIVTRIFLNEDLSKFEYANLTFVWSLSNIILLLLQAFTFMLQPVLFKISDSFDLLKIYNSFYFLFVILNSCLVLFLFLGLKFFDLVKYDASLFSFLSVMTPIFLMASFQGVSQVLFMRSKIIYLSLPLSISFIFQIISLHYNFYNSWEYYFIQFGLFSYISSFIFIFYLFPGFILPIKNLIFILISIIISLYFDFIYYIILALGFISVIIFSNFKNFTNMYKNEI